MQVGIDGLTVVANKDLAIPDDCITTANLKKLLDPSRRSPTTRSSAPASPTRRCRSSRRARSRARTTTSPRTVLETDAEQRTKDVQTSADDNQIVTGIEGTEGALGYVGFAFADEQKDKLKILGVDGGDGCVKPDDRDDRRRHATSRCRGRCSCTRAPRRRRKPEVKGFIQFILDNNEQINEAADYVPLTDELLTEAKANLDGATPVEAPAE